MAKPAISASLSFGKQDFDWDGLLPQILNSDGFGEYVTASMKKYYDEWPQKPQLKVNWTFEAKSFLASAEGNYNYVYSAKDSSEPRKRWIGGFDKDADLTFGVGHKVDSASEYAEILEQIAGKSESEIQDVVEYYLQADIKRFSDAVNKFIYNNKIYLTQNQFDAIVLLVYNNGEGLLDKSSERYYNEDLFEELLKYSGNPSPSYDSEFIIKGFTYTRVDSVRVDGLVTRCNNEISLFLRNDYQYYTKEELISMVRNYID